MSLSVHSNGSDVSNSSRNPLSQNSTSPQWAHSAENTPQSNIISEWAPSIDHILLNQLPMHVHEYQQHSDIDDVAANTNAPRSCGNSSICTDVGLAGDKNAPIEGSQDAASVAKDSTTVNHPNPHTCIDVVPSAADSAAASPTENDPKSAKEHRRELYDGMYDEQSDTLHGQSANELMQFLSDRAREKMCIQLKRPLHSDLIIPRQWFRDVLRLADRFTDKLCRLINSLEADHGTSTRRSKAPAAQRPCRHSVGTHDKFRSPDIPVDETDVQPPDNPTKRLRTKP